MIRLARRSNLAAQITERLFEAILQGELKPGERIIETKMARQLGVGQSTFREALQALEHRGLITKDRGTFVTRLTLQDFEALFTVRLELEPLAASMACGKLTCKHIRQLEFFLREMKKARQRRDFITLVKNDIAFHQLIWELPQVSSLNRILNLVLSPLFAFSLNTLFHASSDDLSLVEERFEREYEDHCRLLTALREGKPDEVKREFRIIMQRYLQETLDDAKAGRAQGTSSQPHPANGQTLAEVRESLLEDRAH
jgi:DNA-binding GntR family transcriptional regulator